MSFLQFIGINWPAVSELKSWITSRTRSALVNVTRYIIWRNKHTADERLRDVVARANVA